MHKFSALRKTNVSDTYTAAYLGQPGPLDDLIHVNPGFRVLKTLPSSPPYWQSRQKDIFAFIRWLGILTFFGSFSAAETKWTDLLKNLRLGVTVKFLPGDDITNLIWQQKSELIQSVPALVLYILTTEFT